MSENLIRQIYRKLFYHQQWFLAIFDRNKRIDGKSSYHIIKPFRKGDFYADPFLVKKDGHNYIFFEDFRYSESKAVISCMRYKDGECVDRQVVLERNYHLSYPFVFEWNDELYMIPETSQNRTVELYRCAKFPAKWELEKVLMKDVCAADTTVVDYEGKLWMFTTIWQPDKQENTELFLFCSDSLLGEWKGHPQNPVVRDISSARPAGKVFWESGSLIRPSQDCSKRYGYSVKLNRIDVLSDEVYSEKCLKEIFPDWHFDNLSTHTFNHNEDLQIIDGQELVADVWKVPKKLFIVIKRIRNYINKNIKSGGCNSEKMESKIKEDSWIKKRLRML
jgi:hypothetical protein